MMMRNLFYILLISFLAGCGYRMGFYIEPSPIEAVTDKQERFFEVIEDSELEDLAENY